MRPFLFRIALVILVLAPATVSAQLRDTFSEDIDERGGGDRTRAMGVVYDSRGAPLTGVQIWVMNDNAPADRIRGRARKTGEYLVRDVGRLYQPEDIQGIALRLRFEVDGYLPVEAVAPVERNGLVEIYPVMWREDEGPSETDTRRLMLTGRVVNSKGKGIKGAAIAITDTTGSALGIETTTLKNGSYRLLLWDVPEVIVVTVTAAGEEQRHTLSLQGEARHDLLTVAERSFDF